MRRLPAHRQDDLGRLDYTSAGQAEADLSSAQQALGVVLNRTDLTPAERRDFKAAQRSVGRALAAIRRHVDIDGIATPKNDGQKDLMAGLRASLSRASTPTDESAQSRTSGGDRV